jgi:hypothetical protein
MKSIACLRSCLCLSDGEGSSRRRYPDNKRVIEVVCLETMPSSISIPTGSHEFAQVFIRVDREKVYTGVIPSGGSSLPMVQ